MLWPRIFILKMFFYDFLKFCFINQSDTVEALSFQIRSNQIDRTNSDMLFLDSCINIPGASKTRRDATETGVIISSKSSEAKVKVKKQTPHSEPVGTLTCLLHALKSVEICMKNYPIITASAGAL